MYYQTIKIDGKRRWNPNDPRFKNKGRLCDVPGCGKTFYAKGLCHTHHASLIRRGFLACSVRFWGNCIVSGCDKEAKGSHGLCGFHYQRKISGIQLEKPKGNNGPLNIHWNGGVSEYPNHYQMKKIRKVVLAEENYTCHFCGHPANQIHHLDHSKTNHVRSNLVACCHSCNIALAGPHQSKYTRAYGKSLKELSKQLGLYSYKITAMHRNGILRRALHVDEIEAILF